MKNILFILAAVTFCNLPALAQKIVPLNFEVKADVSSQNSKVTTNGVIITIAAPVKTTITTASLLQVLAVDENMEGNYAQTTFPKGAKIVFLDHVDNFVSSYFIVADGKGNPLVNVSDLLTFEQVINTEVDSGKYDDSTGLVSGYEQTYLGTLRFDDTGIGGGTTMYLGGIVESKTSDSTPNKVGLYKETISSKISSGVGAGTFGGVGAVITGSGSASGSAEFGE